MLNLDFTDVAPENEILKMILNKDPRNLQTDRG